MACQVLHVASAFALQGQVAEHIERSLHPHTLAAKPGSTYWRGRHVFLSLYTVVEVREPPT